LTRRKTISVAWLASLFLMGRAGAMPAGEQTQAPLRRIDHIMIRTDDPGKLYRLFTETLQMPSAWPLATRGGVTSGGAGFGTANIEAIQFPGQAASQTRLVGFGFEPSPLAECLAELRRRGVGYGEPRPFVATGADGSKQTLFTNVTLQELSDADRPANATMHIFLSEYAPAYVNVDERRARLRKELQDRSGGPLGVIGVKELLVGATDMKIATSLWSKLLAPQRPSASGVWQVGDGPAIRLVSADENKLEGIVIRVVSLERAKAALRERGLLGSVTSDAAMMDPARIDGLSIRLVER
jgi:hypothetical protein